MSRVTVMARLSSYLADGMKTADQMPAHKTLHLATIARHLAKTDAPSALFPVIHRSCDLYTRCASFSFPSASFILPPGLLIPGMSASRHKTETKSSRAKRGPDKETILYVHQLSSRSAARACNIELFLLADAPRRR